MVYLSGPAYPGCPGKEAVNGRLCVINIFCLFCGLLTQLFPWLLDLVLIMVVDYQELLFMWRDLQCFDAVVWVAKRASGL